VHIATTDHLRWRKARSWNNMNRDHDQKLPLSRYRVTASPMVVGTAVMAALSPLARRRTPLRESIYRLLSRRPGRSWTVAALCVELDGSTRRSRNAVRDALYVLLADGALTTVNGQRALTVELTTHGDIALRALLAKWDSHVPATSHIDPHRSDMDGSSSLAPDSGSGSLILIGDQPALIELSGELNAADETIGAALAAALDGDKAAIIVDLRAMRALDADTLQLLVRPNRPENLARGELHVTGAHGQLPIYPQYDTSGRGQAARERAEQARQRAAELHNRLIQLAGGTGGTAFNIGSGNEYVDKAHWHAMQARRRAAAAWRHSASAHEHAVQLHQRLAQIRPDRARSHEAAAAEHRRAAQADRIRASRDA
jgi:hypothetical protein